MSSGVHVRADFPLLSSGKGASLAYLDSAATAQKPKVVIDALSEYYTTSNANVHRGVYYLSEQSTLLWEESKAAVAAFFGADQEELLFVRNTTEAINGAVYGWGEHVIQPGDVIVTSLLEHHSNFVPWQQLANRKNAQLQVAGVLDDGQLDMASLEYILKKNGKSIKLITLSYVSNVLGVATDLVAVGQLLHQHAPNARLLIDAAQAAPHVPINFHSLPVDMLAFSGHKLYGPMGIGGLLVKRKLLESEEFAPWLYGGGMIGGVRVNQTTFNDDLNERYTAGTPDVASALGLAKAARYIEDIGWKNIQTHETEILDYALSRLLAMPELTVVGPHASAQRVGSVAFLYNGVHAHDVAQVLDSSNVAVRSGHHCAMPLHEHFGWASTIRASFGLYNTTEDVDRLLEGLAKVRTVFGT